MPKKPRKKKTLLQLLNQKVDVDELLESIFIDPDNLLESSLEQPDLTVRSGQLRVQRMHVTKKLKTKLNLSRSKVGLRFRAVRDNGGRKEFTNDAVKERIELDPTVRRLQRKVDRAETLEELSKILMEGFRQRGDSIRVIVAAGKVSAHARELEVLKHSKLARRIRKQIKDGWN